MLILTMSPGMASAMVAGLGSGKPAAAGRLLAVQESDEAGALVCHSADAVSTASCSSINAFGDAAAVAPGRSRTTTMVFTNAGSVPAASFAVDAGACSQLRSGRTSGSATDLCDLFSVRLAVAGATVFEGTATEFGRAEAIEILSRAGVGPLASGDSITVTLTLRLSAAADNRYQGLRIATPISWTFGT